MVVAIVVGDDSGSLRLFCLQKLMGANKANNRPSECGFNCDLGTVEAIVPIPTWQPLSDMQPSNKGVHAAHYGTRPTIKDCVLSVSHAKG